MKTKKSMRMLSFLLIALLCLSPLSGCGKGAVSSDNESFEMGNFTLIGDESQEQGNTSGKDSAGNTSTASGGGSNPANTITHTDSATSLTAEQVLNSMPKAKQKTLKICYWEDLHNTSYGNAISEFEKRTGISIKTQMITKDTYNSEVAALIASGDSPDMVLCITNEMAVVKNLQPITKSGFNFNDTAWDTETMKNFTFGGNTYAMNVKNSPKQNISVLVYNQKALKKAEMEDPGTIWKNNPDDWNWDKLWSMCGTFLTKNKNKEGYYGINFGLEDTYLRCFNTGLFGYNPDSGKYEADIKTEESVKRYTILKEMIDKKYVAPVSDSDSFVMGNTLFAATFSSALEKKNNKFYSAIRNDLGVVPFPTDSLTSPGYEYCAWGIPIGAKNAQAVPYLVRFVFGPDLYDMNSFYMNDQAKTVVDAMQSRAKLCYKSGWRYDIWNSLINGTSAQVKTVLDSYSGSIDDTVALQNEEISGLSK